MCPNSENTMPTDKSTTLFIEMIGAIVTEHVIVGNKGFIYSLIES